MDLRTTAAGPLERHAGHASRDAANLPTDVGVGANTFSILTKEERRASLRADGWLIRGGGRVYEGLRSWLRDLQADRLRAARRLTSQYRRYLALSQGME